MNYWEWKLTLKPVQPWSEIVVARLADFGFESFVEQETGVDAFIQEILLIESDTIQAELQQWAKDSDIDLGIEKLFHPHQNWNANWEKDFDPVYIDDYGTILAPFHDKSRGKGLVLEIQPQMSFGTGHHQTTYLMAKSLFEMETIPHEVLDMGSGTGILAILAEKLGAKRCLAIDIEEWSAKNGQENANRNQCKNVTSIHGDIQDIEGKSFGMILANINKNVLKTHMSQYAASLEKKGVLLLSGFFDTDTDEISAFAETFGLTTTTIHTKDNWANMLLIKSI